MTDCYWSSVSKPRELLSREGGRGPRESISSGHVPGCQSAGDPGPAIWHVGIFRVGGKPPCWNFGGDIPRQEPVHPIHGIRGDVLQHVRAANAEGLRRSRELFEASVLQDVPLVGRAAHFIVIYLTSSRSAVSAHDCDGATVYDVVDLQMLAGRNVFGAGELDRRLADRTAVFCDPHPQYRIGFCACSRLFVCRDRGTVDSFDRGGFRYQVACSATVTTCRRSLSGFREEEGKQNLQCIHRKS